jgi:hypothetical protein
MAIISLRSDKGRPLTIQEVDANFDSLNKEVGLKLDTADFNPTTVLAKIVQSDGANSNLDADKVHGFLPSQAATPSTVAVRDEEGDLYATNFRGLHIGDVQGNVLGNLTGTVTGNATNVDGTVQLDHGGTGATDAAGARTALQLGTIATQNANNIAITGGSIAGITDLAVADGGTGASTQSGARANLGLSIGQDVQAYSDLLAAVTAMRTTSAANPPVNGGDNGFIVKTGAGAVIARSIAVGNSLDLTNADGVSGNPTISLNTSPSVASITKTGSNGVGDIGQTGNRFNVIYGRSTSASYADLAEKYTTDQEYEPGTVIVVADGGDSEATQSYKHDQRVLGVVSTAPAHIMNDESTGQAIGLVGRLPVKIVGPIRKGQAIVSTPDGKAQAGDTMYSFGQALETNLDAGVKLVECVIK